MCVKIMKLCSESGDEIVSGDEKIGDDNKGDKSAGMKCHSASKKGNFFIFFHSVRNII